MRLFVFGGGFCGLALARRVIRGGGSAVATSRDAARRELLTTAGLLALDPQDAPAVTAAILGAEAVLTTAAPSAVGCPGLAALGSPLVARARSGSPLWVGYLSSTGVYGDRAGGWVDESSVLGARSSEAVRRVRAEADWRALGRAYARLCVVVFRLPGLYGPGRSALDRVREGRAQRRVKAGQVFSRLHADDLAEALLASIARPRSGAIYNLCDDQPSAPADVVAFACELLEAPKPPITLVADAALSPASRRFWSESKRVSNALAKAELDWRPRHPDYRAGLMSILDGERGAIGASDDREFLDQAQKAREIDRPR